jgi:hypothetical protein
VPSQRLSPPLPLQGGIVDRPLVVHGDEPATQTQTDTFQNVVLDGWMLYGKALCGQTES